MKKIILLLSLVAICVQAQTGSPTRPAGQVAEKTIEEKAEVSSNKTPVPLGKYITGGILGSAVGFGIGHGIQGRYAEKGWIFTATEAAGLGLFLAGCSSIKDRDGDGDKECNNPGLSLLGLGATVGFHIWEIVDVWVGARPVDDSQPTALFIPDSKNPTLLISWKF